MRWRLAFVVLALLAAAPAEAAACTAAQPCVVSVEVTDTTITLAPAVVDQPGTYVLDVSNHGSDEANVSIAGAPVAVAVPANGTAQSTPFSMGSDGLYTVTAGPGSNGTERNATLTVAFPASPPVEPPTGGQDAGSSTLAEVLLPVAVGLALVGLATVVLRSGQRQRHNALFAALYMLSGLKSLSEGLAVDANAYHAQAAMFPPQLFWELLGVFCALGILPVLFLFVSTFPHPAQWLQRAPRAAALAFVPSVLVALILLLLLGGQVDAGAYLGALQGFNILFFAVTVSAVLLLLRTRARSPDPVERTQALYVFIGFAPAFAMGWIISGLQLGESLGLVAAGQGEQAVDLVVHVLSPVTELLAASLVAFAILRYNILGISPRFRLGVKSVVAGLLFVGLFLVTQFVENVILQGKVFSFAGPYGSFILSGATGIVLFKPIEKASDKVSSRLLPAAAAHEKASAAGAAVAAATLHAEQIYHAQATYVLRDAKVTDREMAFLANLRTQLGLSEATARRIEEEVERILKVDLPETGASAAPAAQPPVEPPLQPPAPPV